MQVFALFSVGDNEHQQLLQSKEDDDDDLWSTIVLPLEKHEQPTLIKTWGEFVVLLVRLVTLVMFTQH